MAYADYTFYTEVFFGDVLTEDTAQKWITRASDELDLLTFHRLEDGFPEIESHATKVRKAVCAMAEALHRVDLQQKALQASVDEQGVYRPAIASISSSKESISYMQNATGSIYAKAAADRNELISLLREIAVTYLAGIPDKYGINLLYAGVG